jgi:hypothetical protein
MQALHAAQVIHTARRFVLVLPTPASLRFLFPASGVQHRERQIQMRTILLLATLLAATSALASTNGFGLAVLVDQSPRPQYRHNGTVYVEAIRGQNYALRVTNPTPYRVAVALSVDGLNTIDARHTDARSAAKWVLAPYESTVISGWQVDQQNARNFFFTGERRSYGARLGQTDNLGVIEAVFYREPRPRVREYAPRNSEPKSESEGGVEGGAAAPQAQKRDALSDDYAATGMGQRDRHEVESVDIELEPEPVASVRIRYEFTPQLVKMGILPSHSPMERRERASGFSSFCPER